MLKKIYYFIHGLDVLLDITMKRSCSIS